MKHILFIVALAFMLASCSNRPSEQNDVADLTKAHLDKGYALLENDSLPLAFGEFLEAARLLEMTDDRPSDDRLHLLAVTYFNIGLCFRQQMANNEELDAYQTSCRYAESAHDSTTLARVYPEMAASFECLLEYDSAQAYLDKALCVIDSINDAQNYLAALYVESSILYDQELFDESYAVSEKMIAYKLEHGMSASNDSVGMGMNIFFEGRHGDAKPYLLKVIGSEVGEPMNSAVMSLLQTIFEEEGNADSAAFCQQHFPAYVEAESKRAFDNSLIIRQYDGYKAERDAFGADLRQRDAKRRMACVLALAGLLVAVLALAVLRRKRNAADAARQNGGFADEPVCLAIVTSLHGKNIKRMATASDYPELKLGDGQLLELTHAAKKHYPDLDAELERNGVEPGSAMLHLCHLYLLGVDAKQAAMLLGRDYSTIIRYEKKLKAVLGTDAPLQLFLKGIASR